VVHNNLNLICIVSICIFSSCAPLNNNLEDSLKDEPIILGVQSDFEDLEIEKLREQSSRTRYQTINDKISNNEEIHIRLKLTLQYFYYVTEGLDGDVHVHVFEPIGLEDVLNDIEYAEEIYKDLNIKFTITDVTYLLKKYDVDNDEDLTEEIIRYIIFNDYMDNIRFLIDAVQHKNAISVFYTVSIGDGVSGLSTFPWHISPYGIQVDRLSATEFVLAHEIGHYFGLYHTFQDPTDHVDDTPYENIPMEKVGTEEDPNSNNVMSYPDWPMGDLILTNGQLSRVKTFLTTTRNSHVILKEDNDYELISSGISDDDRREFLEHCKEYFMIELIKSERLKASLEKDEQNHEELDSPIGTYKPVEDPGLINFLPYKNHEDDVYG